MRIAVLCNDRLGIPALQWLAQNRLLLAAGTSDRSPEMIGIMQQISAQAAVPSRIFTKENFETQLTEWLTQYRPDVVIVKTFPFRIPKSVLNIPKHGFINFHYAPLPQWRGSNPLFWMIRNGIETGGIAVHRMNEKFDRGPLLLQQEVQFVPESTFGMCSTQLAYAGAQLTQVLLNQLPAVLREIPQAEEQAKWYGRPKPSDLFINWNEMQAKEICALVRACNPWQKGAATRINNWTMGISDASVCSGLQVTDTPPGTILALSEAEGCVIACTNSNAVKAEVIYTEEGFFSAKQLIRFGIQKGMRFE